MAREVRGVVIRGAVGGLGEDDEFFTSLEMQGHQCCHSFLQSGEIEVV